eukprot:COSAG06_NODE_997_length_11148_cov_5.400489_2_plen_103_part_00
MNHQVDKRGNLTLAGFLSCVYKQTVENEAAIVWQLQQLGYGSREAADPVLSGGATIDERDDLGLTPLDYAESTDVVTLLKKAPAPARSAPKDRTRQAKKLEP